MVYFSLFSCLSFCLSMSHTVPWSSCLFVLTSLMLLFVFLLLCRPVSFSSVNLSSCLSVFLPSVFFFPVPFSSCLFVFPFPCHSISLSSYPVFFIPVALSSCLLIFLSLFRQFSLSFYLFYSVFLTSCSFVILSLYLPVFYFSVFLYSCPIFVMSPYFSVSLSSLSYLPVS